MLFFVFVTVVTARLQVTTHVRTYSHFGVGTPILISSSRGIFFVDFPEAKFLDVIETKVFRVFLLAILSHLCLVISISIKLTQPLTISKVQLQYTV